MSKWNDILLVPSKVAKHASPNAYALCIMMLKYKYIFILLLRTRIAHFIFVYKQ